VLRTSIVSLFLMASCASSPSSSLAVNHVSIVDSSGRPRMVIAAPLDPPRVDGREYPRSGDVVGIQLLDPRGNEIGGLGIADDASARLLCFDHATAEALCIVSSSDYMGISIYDPPAPGTPVGKVGASRAEISVVPGKTAELALRDRDGKLRIRLAVDERGAASISVLDAAGNAVWTAPGPEASRAH
jgi:hypothetical protein